MHVYKKSLLRAGIYCLLGGLLTLPVSCDPAKENALTPDKNRSGRLDQAGCGGFTAGRFLGTWTVTNSRLQVFVVPDGRQYIAQIFPDNNQFYIRGKAFLRRGDIADKSYSDGEIECFEGDPGDAFGWGVSTFQLPAGFEFVPGPNSYQASCNPKFSLGASSGARVNIAFWTVTQQAVEGRFFRGHWWVCQNVSSSLSGRDSFVIRGKNMLLRSDVRFFDDPWDRGRTRCFGGEDTGVGGLVGPVSAPPELVNEGYDRGQFSDGTPYFVRR